MPSYSSTQSPARVNDTSGENMDSGTRCNICFYYEALDAESLRHQKISNYNTLPYLCEWPGCSIATTKEDTLDAHVQHYHELKTWVCPVRIWEELRLQFAMRGAI